MKKKHESGLAGHPLIILVSVISGLIGIIIFFSGKPYFKEYLPKQKDATEESQYQNISPKENDASTHPKEREKEFTKQNVELNNPLRTEIISNFFKVTTFSTSLTSQNVIMQFEGAEYGSLTRDEECLEKAGADCKNFYSPANAAIVTILHIAFKAQHGAEKAWVKNLHDGAYIVDQDGYRSNFLKETGSYNRPSGWLSSDKYYDLSPQEKFRTDWYFDCFGSSGRPVDTVSVFDHNGNRLFEIETIKPENDK